MVLSVEEQTEMTSIEEIPENDRTPDQADRLTFLQQQQQQEAPSPLQGGRRRRGKKSRKSRKGKKPRKGKKSRKNKRTKRR